MPRVNLTLRAAASFRGGSVVCHRAGNDVATSPCRSCQERGRRRVFYLAPSFLLFSFFLRSIAVRSKCDIEKCLLYRLAVRLRVRTKQIATSRIGADRNKEKKSIGADLRASFALQFVLSP